VRIQSLKPLKIQVLIIQTMNNKIQFIKKIINKKKMKIYMVSLYIKQAKGF